MLAKKITYMDYNDVEKTEVHYFNMTKAEIMEYDAEFLPDGVMAYLTKLMESQNVPKIMAAFKDLILRSYGVRDDHGHFIKNQEIRDRFAASEAYSELFMEILQSESSAAAFVNGIIPKVPKADNVTPIPAPVG